MLGVVRGRKRWLATAVALEERCGGGRFVRLAMGTAALWGCRCSLAFRAAVASSTVARVLKYLLGAKGTTGAMPGLRYGTSSGSTRASNAKRLAFSLVSSVFTAKNKKEQ